MMLDAFSLLQNLDIPTIEKLMPAPQEAPAIEQDRGKTHLHFESSRAGGCFSLHLRSTWDDARVAAFHAWKAAQGLHDDTPQMAEEIATHLRKLFGGIMPSAILTAAPRGKTKDDQPHAAHELARASASLLNLQFVETVRRIGIDDALYRSRYHNLRDATTFEALSAIPNDVLIIVIDDVSTTGKTMARMRQALTGHATLLCAYVIWH